MCVCPLMDHGQQPMKMHTEVTLLYNHFYLSLFFFQDETAFESVIPVTTPLDAQTVSLEIGEPSVHSLEIETEVSVVCGGTKEGWSPVAAVVLWCRMLGVLGNINDIESAAIHAQVLESLSQIWYLLEKVTCAFSTHYGVSVIKSNPGFQLNMDA